MLIEMSRRLRNVLKNESGLTTVEWTAIAGAVVIGGITVVWLVMSGLKAPANTISNTVTCTANHNCP